MAHSDFIATGETVTVGVTEFDPVDTVIGLTVVLMSTLCGRCYSSNTFNDYQEGIFFHVGLLKFYGEKQICLHHLRKRSCIGCRPHRQCFEGCVNISDTGSPIGHEG